MPIELVAYALAQTWRILSSRRNQRLAHCATCEQVLEMEQGREVNQQGWAIGWSNQRFLCPACFERVKLAHEAMVPHWWEGGKPPEWWKELGRAGRVQAARTRNKRPQAEELDRLIQAREEQNARGSER